MPDITLREDSHMTEHYRDRRKIDPARGERLGDGTPNDANRIEIGPTRLLGKPICCRARSPAA